MRTGIHGCGGILKLQGDSMSERAKSEPGSGRDLHEHGPTSEASDRYSDAADSSGTDRVRTDGRFEQIVEHSSSVVLCLDPNGNLTFWNKACERYTGHLGEDILGKNFAVTVPAPGDRILLKTVIDKVFQGESFDALSMQFESADGTMRLMECRAFPVFDAQKAVVECALVGQDVTSRRRTEAGLAAELSKFHSLYELAVAMAAEQSLDRNLSLVVEKSRQLLDAEASFIALRDESCGDVYMYTLSGIRTEAFKEMRVPYGVGLGGKVAQKGEGFIIEDYFKQVEPALHEIVRKEGIISAIAVPIQSGAENLGVLYAANRERTTFTISDMDTLSMLGNLAAVEIARQRVQQRLRKAQDELERRVRERTGELLETNQRLEREIRERKIVEGALNQSEDKYRTIIDNIDEVYYEVDSHGYFTFFNAAASLVFGYAHDELVGRNFTDFMDEENADMTFKVFRRAAKEGYSIRSHHCRIRRKDGAERDMELSVYPIKDSPGTLAGFRGIVRDVSARMQAERLLLQTERIKAVGEMAGGVAHNFNNLLQIVMGSSQLAMTHLEMGNFEDIRTKLEQIHETSRLGADTVRRLQDFARSRSEDALFEGRVFDISETVRQAVEMSRPWWQTTPEKEGVRIILRQHLQSGCMVKGKESELFEVVLNLIKNAAEALPKGGQIEVETFTRNDRVHIRVKDNGIGIASENVGRVFEPFWTTKGFQGTGMGLSSSYGIVRSHGGDISLESWEHVGTLFTVKLPAAAPVAEEEIPPPDAGSTPGMRILVIDDIEAVVDMLADGFNEFGHTVYKALSGSEGLEIFRNNPVDAVICDLGMAEMTGWEVARLMRDHRSEQNKSKIPFVLLTGWAGQLEETEAEIQESGVDMVMEKPVIIPRLLNEVRGLVERLDKADGK